MSQDTIESLRARVAKLERDAEMYGPNKLAIEKQAWVMADSVREIRELRDQLAAQALTIKTMREALEKFIDSHEECTDFDGFTAQIVSMDDYHEAQEAISIPDNSTEVLQEWLDKQFGEPVASIVEMSIAGVPTPKGIDWLSAPNLGENLYRKPEIK